MERPELKTFYDRGLKNGKPAKVALIAVARKLLIILNHIAKKIVTEYEFVA
jgi:hypothetical protein